MGYLLDSDLDIEETLEEQDRKGSLSFDSGCEDN